MDKIKIDFNNITQDNFLGCNAVYHWFSCAKDNEGRTPTDQEFKIELERIKNMRLNIVRTIFSMGATFDKGNKLNFETESMLAFYKWANALKDIGVNIALNTTWGCRDSYDDVKKYFNVDGEEIFEKYGEWVVALYKELQKRNLTNIKYLVVITEPDTHEEWETIELCWENWSKFVKGCHDQFVKAGLRDKVVLVGPNEGSTTTSSMLDYVREHVDECVDIYSSHDYAFNWEKDRDTYLEWERDMKAGISKVPKGKNYWFDEYGLVHWAMEKAYISQQLRWHDGQYGIHLALNAVSALKYGVQTTLLWTLFDQQFPNSKMDGIDAFVQGTHKWGVCPKVRESKVPYPCYYAFTLMSKYLGNDNTKVFDVDFNGKVRLGAVKTADNNYSFIAVNWGDNESEFEFNTPDGVAKLNRHIYVAKDIKPDERAEIIGIDKVFDCKGKLTDKLPANSFAIYTTDKD